ncbi:tripartite tricarboxylate transporter permease [Stutzerimonas azotifigens]|uniref:tripartite tricarboxylate transporter permease n=1 Tax=Stutzerimonas azotifigens TaxID=291995 RepID=UPI0003F76E02|nr:tripartite tricarboxylate transporter permease [Stutzerimonas azotifigens]
MLDIFLVSLSELITPTGLALLLGASIIGLIIGTLPGLNVAMAVAILLPLTFSMAPALGLSALVAVYVGGMSGGAVSAVLLNMPGTSSAIATTFEGFPMSRKGQAVKALATCTLASFAGGLIGLFLLVAFAPMAARLALKLGPAEYFSLSLMALAMVTILARGSMVKGLLACLLGMLGGTVGFAPIDGTARFTLGSMDLMAGLGVIPVMIGLFAITQALREAYDNKPLTSSFTFEKKGLDVTWREVQQNIGNIIRSSLIGVGIGVLPGMGGTASNMIAYAAAQQSSKHRAEFGKGHVDGLWATESSNSAGVGGALLPLITLGIPGDGVTAIMIGAFMIHGLQPGPLLFTEQPGIVTSIYAALLIAIVFVVAFQLLTLRVFPRVLGIPKHYLVPVIVVLSVFGAFAADNNMFDIWVMFGTGLIGIILISVGLPVGPLILGFILGPIVETNLRRALMHSNGDATVFFTEPISLVFMLAIIAFVLFGVLKNTCSGWFGRLASR